MLGLCEWELRRLKRWNPFEAGKSITSFPFSPIVKFLHNFVNNVGMFHIRIAKMLDCFSNFSAIFADSQIFYKIIKMSITLKRLEIYRFQFDFIMIMRRLIWCSIQCWIWFSPSPPLPKARPGTESARATGWRAAPLRPRRLHGVLHDALQPQISPSGPSKESPFFFFLSFLLGDAFRKQSSGSKKVSISF